MKKKLVLSAMLVCLLTLGLSLLGCPTDSDDGGGGIDTAKLKGNWIRDDNANYNIEFGDLKTTGIQIDYSNKNDVIGGGTISVNGDVIGSGDDSFKVAFEGERLKVSEGKGDFITFNGTYTKQ
jgi:hypothetical protein